MHVNHVRGRPLKTVPIVVLTAVYRLDLPAITFRQLKALL